MHITEAVTILREDLEHKKRHFPNHPADQVHKKRLIDALEVAVQLMTVEVEEDSEIEARIAELDATYAAASGRVNGGMIEVDMVGDVDESGDAPSEAEETAQTEADKLRKWHMAEARKGLTDMKFHVDPTTPPASVEEMCADVNKFIALDRNALEDVKEAEVK